MKKRRSLLSLILTISLVFTGCGGKQTTSHPSSTANNSPKNQPTSVPEDKSPIPGPELPLANAISLGNNIIELESDLFAVRYNGNYGFDNFLAQGGATSDREVVQYLTENLIGNLGLDFLGNFFGCSTITADGPYGGILFGRNFDWNTCEAMIVEAHPENGYASLSTVNMDFITIGTGGMMGTALKLDQVRTLAALYAPLDGMNEKGLAVSVNMIQDNATISQSTGKPGITTTTAVRLLLDKAATVEEALELLCQYDLHASMGLMVHFALADSTGHSVVVEYIENEIHVVGTLVVTNFYLTPGEKYGVGTSQSHARYEILTNLLAESPTLTQEGVRDALSSVSKGNFGEFESTEWSIVFDLTAKTALYYRRENYNDSWLFALR
ncbi:MAG: linear amide C-N hydrolase [Anaerotruncus sp.]|nr:linear amide C-N hydrolase [Anaerotruncus sp.]